jgi:hypothetical protein
MLYLQKHSTKSLLSKIPKSAHFISMIIVKTFNSMRNYFLTSLLSLVSVISFAQQASEIDPKFVKLPRYANLAAITNVITGITTPTQGMMVYNIGTASNWYYNGSAWTNTATSLALPYLQTQASANPLISLTNSGSNTAFEGINSGTGTAGRFEINNSASSSPALISTTDGGGKAFTAVNSGTGGAGTFQITNTSNNNDVINSTSLGTGIAGNFVISNATNSSNAIKSSTNGLGVAGHFQINNAANSSDGIYSETNGNGNAFNAVNIGGGNAATFQIFNNTNVNNTISATTNGTGRAGHFVINNLTSTNYALSAVNTGLGQAGNFSILNASNSNVALNASTTGTGRAAYFQGTNALETNGTIKFGGSGVGTPAASKFLASIDAAGTAQWQYLIPYGRIQPLSNDALFFIGNSGNATSFIGMPTTAIEGVINGTTGSLSFIGFAAGVVGKAEGTTLNNGSTTAGIFGYGSSAYNMGVYGYSEESYGVKAYSINGVGFTASSGTKESAIFTNQVNNFPTVKIENASSGNANALELNGGLKVSGRKTAFKITTSATYISGNKFGILNTTMANASTDILIVTYEYTGGSYLNKQFATYWNGGNWEIHLTDGSAMPVGITFNVLVIKQ